MTRALPLAVLLLGSACTSGGADASGTEEFWRRLEESQRVRLFSNCASLGLFVWVNGEESEEELEELKERLDTMAESRLRAARLYGPDTGFVLEAFPTLDTSDALQAFPRLFVEVTVLSPAFMYTVTLQKWLRDEVAGAESRVSTWDRSAVGIYDNDTDYIVQGVSEVLDGFILEYLRVNEAAC